MICPKFISHQNKVRHRNAKKAFHGDTVSAILHSSNLRVLDKVRTLHCDVIISKLLWKKIKIIVGKYWHFDLMETKCCECFLFKKINIDAWYKFPENQFRVIKWETLFFFLTGNAWLVPAPSVQGNNLHRKYCFLKMASAAFLFFNLVSLRDVCHILPVDCDEVLLWTRGWHAANIIRWM